jgi:hypothetical protein
MSDELLDAVRKHLLILPEHMKGRRTVELLHLAAGEIERLQARVDELQSVVHADELNVRIEPKADGLPDGTLARYLEHVHGMTPIKTI